GVELLFTMYCDKAGLTLPENRTQQYRGVKWMCVLEDLRSARIYWQRGELTFSAWWRSVRGKKTYADFSWSDPMPFCNDVKKRITYKLKELRDARFAKRISLQPVAEPFAVAASN
ncbi:MAG: hypothetical protein AAB354_04220, partial [candidate division KSB1 bacterium]